MVSPRPSVEALLYQAQKDGVLPITSRCNMKCVFCSNRYNPASAEIMSIGERPFDEIKATLPWLQASSGPVIIGESVTRINEGEPLTHPDFPRILQAVRQDFPKKEVRVTTNGSLLNLDLVSLLSDLGIKLTVSLNSVGNRREIMGDPNPGATLSGVESLGGRVEFDGSLVALPFLVGWDDIRDTAAFLRDSGASTVRVLLPGFSSRHPLYRKMPPDTWEQVKAFCLELTADLHVPVLFDPPGISDTVPSIDYVLDGSPAALAGIRPGDVVVRCGKRKIFSRRDAFLSCYLRENPSVTVRRGDEEIGAVLRKRRRESPGFIVYDDIDVDAYMNWERQTLARKGRDTLILTSYLAKPIIEHVLETRDLKSRVVGVKSHFFGGNIGAGGLLTVGDFVRAFSEATEGVDLPVEVTLPKAAFDPWGRDLEGVHYRAFTDKTSVPVLLGGEK